MAVENKSAPIADTQELVLEPMFLSIGDLVLLKQSNQITIPNAYQRNYQAWKLEKYSSFVIGNWRGFSSKDNYIIVDVRACYENEKNSDNPSKEFLDHLKGYLDNGHTYLAVDGQHRINSNTEYVNGKVPKFAKGVDQTLLFQDNKVNLNLPFMDLPQPIREFYLDQPVIVSMVTKASLPSLKKLFVTSNDGVALKKIEKGMAGNAPNAVDGILDLVGIQHYREFLCKVSGIKSVSKTDCELVGKLLNFEHDRVMVNTEPSALDVLFHTDMDGYKPTSKAEVKRLNRNFGTLYDALSPKLDKGKNKYNVGKFINAYMLISLITDTRQHPLMDDIFGTTTRFKISDPVGFGEWFVKSEDDRMLDKYEKDENGEILVVEKKTPVMKNGSLEYKVKTDPKENVLGYNYATTRESKGEFIIKRQEQLLREFKEWVESPESLGIVKQYDTSKITESVRQQVIVKSGFKSSNGKALSYLEANNGKAFHVDHKVARDNQGSTEIDNLQLMDAKSNIKKSNKEIVTNEN